MRRTPLLLATAAASSALLLSGCGATATPAAAPVAVSPAAATEDAVPLADGLLPAEEFAPDAEVTPVTADQLSAALGAAGEHDPGAVTVTPDTCVTALEAARAALGDPADVQDAAGQVARSGFTASAELLTVGGPGDAVVSTLTDAVAACPTATVSTPMGDAVITFGTVTAPALGDAAAVVPVTATVTRQGGMQIGGSALLGVVQDGDRLLTLVAGAVATAPDAAAFDELLAAAAQHAADTLD
ncbi:hypothetical protein [Modestobacter sp. Leaf380]|uniref:hypothetical protein n=1 Tax=Modestobacter sp. Leaf380 TaxID=1736356 RepID=UPI0012F70BC3|nr:hypothetical protein [Modestobacter sp. Leaf380]